MTAVTRIAIAAILACLIAAPAAALHICAAHDEAVKYLSDKYGEKQIAMGLTNKGAVIEVLTNKSGTTWTIIITYPNGTACIVDAGQFWEDTPLVGESGA